MKANKNGKKISWEYFYLYKSWRKTEQQQQAATVQEMYILLYTALHCTVHYGARYINRTKVQTTRIGAISCAAEMPIQSLFLTSHFTALPSSLTKSLQTSLQGKIQFLSKPINLVKVIFFYNLP